MMKRLPIGFSGLEDMLSNNCLYVDKTRFIAEMVQGSKCYFLSRPRRFGKSLIVDTIKQAFLGNKALFKGLYLENHWDFETTYPVIHISFASNQPYLNQSLELVDKINSVLNRNALEHGLTLRDNLYSDKFQNLIIDMYNKYKQRVVILVDEYDKPILDVIENSDLAKISRNILSGLYSVIKDVDQYLKFVFITGVSRFSQAGLFSGLNNLEDITLNSQYADICGYTHANIENELSAYMKEGNVDLAKLKRWYDGYNFLGTEEQKVYNPFDVLLFCKNKYQYDHYWFRTGTPTFLVSLLEKNNYYLPEVESMLISSTLIGTLDIDHIPIVALLFQTGYLTIDKVVEEDEDTTKYKLCYPNHEVRVSLNNYLAQIGTTATVTEASISKLKQHLKDKNFDEVGQVFVSHFASIPNNWYTQNPMAKYEGFYACIVYSIFSALGYALTPEDTTNTGRMDLSIKTSDKVVIIEFKLSNKGDALDALAQIKDRGYADKYRSLKLPVYILGISFNPETRNLADYKWELI